MNRSAPFVRGARVGDLPALQTVDEAAFGELAYPLFVLRQFFDVHRRHLLVVDADPALLGYVLAGYAAGAQEAWLLGIGVHPDARGLGYGRVLLDHCLARLRADGARAVRLTVRPDNGSAISLYRSVGFTKVGYQPDYYGPGEHRDEMVAALLHDGPESGGFGCRDARGGAG